MWCSTCQQDVPAVAHSLAGQTVCARCLHKLHALPSPEFAALCDEGIALDELAETAAVAKAPSPTAQLDDWNSQQRVRSLGRILRHSSTTSGSRSTTRPGHHRFDVPADLFDDLRERTTPGVAAPTDYASRNVRKTQRAEGGQLAAWLCVAFGALALAGGIGLVAWSLGGANPELWNPALGVTLVGQGLLIFGLVLVVSRLWRNSRLAAGRLRDVHTQLGQLQRTADVLTSMRGGAPAFYADLVRGASPQMLLTNLKGQLDQLATRLGSE